MRVWVEAGIERGSGLDKMFIEIATKNIGFVSCSWSVVSGRGRSLGRSGQRQPSGRTRPRRRPVTTVVSTGNVRPRTAVRALRGSGCTRVLRTCVPSERRTEPCVVIGLRGAQIPGLTVRLINGGSKRWVPE